MASDSSFDVVSQIDRQELVNAVDQATREVTTRFDLKSTGSTVTLEKDAVMLACDTEFTLKAVRDILIERSAKRGFSNEDLRLRQGRASREGHRPPDREAAPGDRPGSRRARSPGWCATSSRS